MEPQPNELTTRTTTTRVEKDTRDKRIDTNGQSLQLVTTITDNCNPLNIQTRCATASEQISITFRSDSNVSVENHVGEDMDVIPLSPQPTIRRRLFRRHNKKH